MEIRLTQCGAEPFFSFFFDDDDYDVKLNHIVEPAPRSEQIPTTRQIMHFKEKEHRKILCRGRPPNLDDTEFMATLHHKVILNM